MALHHVFMPLIKLDTGEETGWENNETLILDRWGIYWGVENIDLKLRREVGVGVSDLGSSERRH